MPSLVELIQHIFSVLYFDLNDIIEVIRDSLFS